jgi:hypothetical protein
MTTVGVSSTKLTFNPSTGILSATGFSGPLSNALTFNTSGGAAAGSTYNGSAARTIDFSTVGAAASSHVHNYAGSASAGGAATSVASAVTFNNGGAGSASGTTFNGSSAITVSYNTVGAPSTTGTNASGSWGISITGSAGSLSTATNQQLNSLGVGTAASGTAGEIRATNNITAYFSDKRLKDIIGTIPNALEKTLSLSGVLFTQNKKAEEFGYNNYNQQVGVIAQEVQQVLPEAIKSAPFDIGENNESISGENYLTVQYEKLVPLLIEAIKEQQKQIDVLNERFEQINK